MTLCVTARKMGCTDFICINGLTKPVEQVITEKTNGGLDFAFACIGNIQAMVRMTNFNFSFKKSWKSLIRSNCNISMQESAVTSTRPGGSAVIVGISNATAPMTVYPAFLLTGRKIIGTLAGGK